MKVICAICLFMISNGSFSQLILPETDTSLIQGFINSNVSVVTGYDYICTAKKCPENPEIRKKIEFDNDGNIIRSTTYEFSKVLLDKQRKFEDGNMIYEAVYKKDSVPFRFSHYEYDSKGNPIHRIDTSGTDRFWYEEINRYDEHNNLTLQKIINQRMDTMIMNYRYRYSDNGKLLQQTSLTEDQKLIQARYYEYNDSGKLIAIMNLDPKKGKVPINRWYYEGNRLKKKELYADGDLTTTHTYEYEKDQVVRELVKDHIHETEYAVTRKIGKHGIKEEIGKYVLDTKLHYKYTTRYNCKGLERKTTYYKPDGSVERVIRKKYDKKGNPMRISFSGTEYEYQIIEYKIGYRTDEP